MKEREREKKRERKREIERKNEENTARYTATPVACGWAGAVLEVTQSFGQEQ